MPLVSRLCVAIGLVALFHAAYSAHEVSALHVATHSPSHGVPLDIQVETLLSVFLTCFGLVLGSDRLMPISWNVWAGKIEKDGGGLNPFRALEDRKGFVDIRKQRKEFADWVRDRRTSIKN